MKTGIYAFLILSFLIFVSLLHYYFKASTEYEELTSKKMSIAIYLNQEIEGLQQIEFTACDSTYLYNVATPYDTIWDHIAINNQSFPCPVNINYIFQNNEMKHIRVDSFNCGGCSGSNFYQLKNDTVQYYYWP